MRAGGQENGRGRRIGLAYRLVGVFAWLVPAERRDEWVQEWRAELETAALEPGDGRWRVAARAAAAFEDALRFRGPGRLRPDGFEWLREARRAVRALARTPLFATAVVLTQALGIGANAALFAVIDAALMEPLPYPSPARLVVIGTTSAEGEPMRFVSTPDYDDLVERIRRVEHVAFRIGGSATYLAEEPQRLMTASVSSSFFRLFGTRAHVGRYLLPEEDAPDKFAAVLSHGFWQRAFGGDPKVVNQTVMLDGQPYVVVGVAEPGLRDPVADVDLWTSRPRYVDLARRDQPWLDVYARLAPGAALEEARAELAAFSQELAREYPATNEGRALTMDSMAETVAAPVRTALLVLGAVVILLLAITCANVANLVLVRSAGRSREMAVRLSLGAGRARLARQLVTEGLVLALAGGLAGLAVGAGATRVFVALGAPGLPRLADVELDGTVLLFTLLLSSATGIVFGLAPLLQVSGQSPSASLRESGRGGESRRVRRVRRVLVVAEVAGSVMLLIGAGLLVRSLVHLTRTDTGVRTEGVLTFQLAPPRVATADAAGGASSRFASPAELRTFYDRVLEGIARIPGVEAVGGINLLPFTYNQLYEYRRDDRPAEPGRAEHVEVRIIEPDYFAAVGMRTVAGRTLGDRDEGGAPPALVIDEEFARTVFPGEDPIGRRITLLWGAGLPAVSYEIVGIVGAVRLDGPASSPSPVVYIHRGHDSSPYWMHFAHTITVRARGDLGALAREARNVVWSIDRTAPITDVMPFDRLLDRFVAGTRYRMLLLGGFAVLATLLAAVGIGGIVAYAVTQRGAELGLRQALGAAPGMVVRLVLREGMRLAAVGVTLGIAIAVAGTRLLRSFLYGVGTADPFTYVAAAATLAAITLLAAWIPARRATRVRPADALRTQA